MMGETRQKETQPLSRLEWLFQLCGALVVVYLTVFAISA